MTDPCPRHDHDSAHTVTIVELAPPCGCRVTRTTLDQVMHRHAVLAVSEPVDESPRRCGAKRTPNGVVSCWHDLGHVGAHSWEPKA